MQIKFQFLCQFIKYVLYWCIQKYYFGCKIWCQKVATLHIESVCIFGLNIWTPFKNKHCKSSDCILNSKKVNCVSHLDLLGTHRTLINCTDFYFMVHSHVITQKMKRENDSNFLATKIPKRFLALMVKTIPFCVLWRKFDCFNAHKNKSISVANVAKVAIQFTFSTNSLKMLLLKNPKPLNLSWRKRLFSS